MKLTDSAGEWLRLTEHYRKLTDEELLKLARQPSSLTDDARQVLRNEMSARRLELPPEEAPTDERPAYVEPDPDSIYAEERELVQICTVWSLRDALQLQALFDTAGIPFYIGEKKLTRVEDGAMNFAEGVPVGVMRIGYPWAQEAMRRCEPVDEPPDFKEEEKEIPVTCPKCRSTDVIFERGSPESQMGKQDYTAKFEWTCASCGHHWIDDGVVKEK
jgi:DNA-directed RNA polymerase subunit M/transcription elongation factor TFIIS